MCVCVRACVCDDGGGGNNDDDDDDDDKQACVRRRCMHGSIKNRSSCKVKERSCFQAFAVFQLERCVHPTVTNSATARLSLIKSPIRNVIRSVNRRHTITNGWSNFLLNYMSKWFAANGLHISTGKTNTLHFKINHLPK